MFPTVQIFMVGIYVIPTSTVVKVKLTKLIIKSFVREICFTLSVALTTKLNYKRLLNT